MNLQNTKQFASFLISPWFFVQVLLFHTRHSHNIVSYVLTVNWQTEKTPLRYNLILKDHLQV